MTVRDDRARDGVWALVLTYGERYALLRQCLAGLRACGVESVLVVANSPPYDLQGRLSTDPSDLPRHVEVVAAEENLGSAGGIRLGIAAALRQPEVRTLWLFDDDNVPAPDALDAMLEAEAALRQDHDIDLYGLLSYRPHKTYLRQLVEGQPVSRVYPVPGSFSGIHLVSHYRRLQSRALGSSSLVSDQPPRQRSTPIAIPWAPWGGLWLPRRTIQAVGLPRADFFLYADDTEYTFRITAQGGSLHVVPRSQVYDVDLVRFGTARTSIFRSLLTEPSDARVYYLLRNQTYFERHVVARGSAVYPLNRALFEARLLTETVRQRRLGRLLLLRRAIRDGLSGRLGRRRDLGL